MRNFFPHPHGGASNRQGTIFVAAVKTAAKATRLVPFQFSVVQSYILEFGHQYMRVVKDGGQVVLGSTPTAWNSGTTYAIADHCSKSGVNYYALQASTNKDPATETAYWSPITGLIVEIPTPYVEADLALLKFEQSADTLYVCHPSYAPRKITRSSHTQWSIATISFAASIAAPTSPSCSGSGKMFVVTAVTSTGVESVPSAEEEGDYGNTISWTASSGASEYKIYQKIDGIYCYLGRAVGTSYAIPSSPTVSYDVSPPAAATPFGSTNNYPGVCAFYDQRLIFARTNNKPQSFWGSVTGDFENMQTSSPIKDDDAFNFTINSQQVNEIRWLAALSDLIIGTSGAEWKLGPGGQTDGITPTSAKLTVQSRWGVGDLPSIMIGNSVLFVDGSTKKIRDLMYSLERDGYDGSDLTIMAQHLFEYYGIVSWAWQAHPDSVIWCVRDDGVLCGLTYNKEHQIFGWHRHDTDGEFESVACIATAEGVSEVYFVVKRTINGSTVRYIEQLATRDWTDVEDAYFVDSGLSYDGSVAATLTPGTGATTEGTENVTFTAGSSKFVNGDVGREIHYRYVDADGVAHTAKAVITAYSSGTVVSATILLAWPSLSAIASGDWRMSVTSVSGLSHLEGKTVVVLADGNVINSLVVASGAITLPNPASKVHVGLPYTCDLETLGFNYQTQTGTVQDRIRRVLSVVLRFRNTRACWAGPDEDHLDELAFRDTEDYGEPTGLYSADKEVMLEPGELREGSVFMRVTEPLPVTVQAIFARMHHGEK
jgi:hypothetical protein